MYKTSKDHDCALSQNEQVLLIPIGCSMMQYMAGHHVYHIINLPPHHLSPSFVVNELELATGAIYSGWPTMRPLT